MNYRTFHVGLLAYCDEEPKRLPKFGGLVCISATTCRKIRGAESLEEIRYARAELGWLASHACVNTVQDKRHR